MPDSSSDQKLEQLMAYPETSRDDVFVMGVMQNVRHEQRTRKAILWVFGLIGALFGIAGAAMLSGTITQLFTFSVNMPATESMQVVLFIVAGAAFYIWMMNDDFNLDN